MQPFSEGAARAAVVARARDWVGTPYHPGADLRGIGVDCGMLLVRVFVDCGLAPPFDPRPYPADWHLHRDEERYLGHVLAHCREAQAQAPKPGDVVLFRWGRCYSHGAIVVRAAPLTVVHAFQPAALVLEEQVSRNARLANPARRPRFFSMWPEEGRP